MRAVVLHVLVLAYAAYLLVMAGVAFLGLAPAVTIGLSLLGNALFVAAAVVFGIWLADAYAWAGEGKHGKAWTVGSWYIPVGTIATPHAPMIDLWRRATGRAPDGSVWTWLIGWSAWWFVATISFVLGMALGIDAALAGSTSGSSEPADLPQSLLWLSVAQALLACVAAVGLVLTTRALEATQVVPPAPYPPAH